jgi:Mg-chelatase subunit ChlD
MNGELTANDENTVSEPEAGADGEGNALGDDSDGPISGEGELADAIDVTMWYDENCNNVYEPGGETGGPLCIQIVLDASGSMSGNRNTQAINGAKTLAESILQDGPAGSRVGVTFFSASGYDQSAQVIQTLTDDLDDVLDAIDTLPANGSNTAIGEGIEAAQSDLENCDDDESPTMIVLTDGDNNAGTDPGVAADDAKGDGTTIYALGVGGAQVSTLNAISSDPDEEYVFFASDDGALEQAFGLLGETLLGESIIFEGSLADAMAELEEGIALDGNRATEAREPFDGGLTQCVGFEWCLPTDVGNEVQTDSVAFDLGFYAEQFRHNDDPQVTFNGTEANSTSTGNVSQ